MTVRYNIFGYLIGEGFRNVFKNKKSTIASLIIMFCNYVCIWNIFYSRRKCKSFNEKQLNNSKECQYLFMIQQQKHNRNELESKIRNMPYVNTVTFKSKEDALEEVKRLFKDKKNLMSTYEKENPFKASFVVTLTDLEKSR